MKSLLAFCFLLSFFVNSFGQTSDDQCKNDLNNFLACAKNSISDSDRQARKKELEDKGTQCFQQNGCDPPDWNANPMGGKGPGGAGGMSMPESVKKCIKQKMMAKIGAKLNECLAKRNVRNVDWQAFSDSAESGMGAVGGSGDMQKGMMAIFNAVKGVDKCCQAKKGGDTNAVHPLEQCLQDTKKGIKPKICAALKPCEDKVSPPCKSRGQEIRKALCLCKKEKEQDIAGKLKVLGQQPKVSFKDLINTVADDQEVNNIMADVDQCYQEQNEPEPAMLKLAMAMMRNGGGGGGMGAAMSINGSTCIIMSDMLTLDANDKSECDNCP